MKKSLLLPIILLFLFAPCFSFANGGNDRDYTVAYNQLSPSEFTLNYKIGDFSIDEKVKNGQTFSVISFNGNTVTTRKGWAELPIISTSVQLSPDKNVLVEVVYSEYEDYDLENPILPSRGTIYRNQDPSTIPYEIDPASIVDSWYPADLFTGSDPYIIRDVRGMNIHIYPFIYNAVQKKIRVYKKITLKVSEDNTPPVNPLPSTDNKVCREMAGIYESMFINYNQNPVRWTQELGEYGEILVIYTSAYATAIQPWITWKKEKGYQVHELSVSTGANVKTDILTEYNSNNNILYVLLVGDWADIKSDLGSSGNAPTDPVLGCVVGTDDYHDIIIGRFSASSAAHVTTQGNKTITYERDPETGGTWYSQALGIASAEGPGDDGEYDYEQIDNIHDGRLLNFTYTTCNEVYDPGATATQVANYVNNGVSVINYCGHGDHSYWVTSNYSTTNVNSSTNGAKLPFVFSVACIVGEFHTGSDCLAEALLKKDGGGAVAAWMSTINQPWQPPMRGQDYANDILVQGYNYTTGLGSGTSTTYGKTTFGSITFNAGALMIAESSTSSDLDTYKTWTVFGDPSVQVRTEAPKAITLSNYIINPGTYATTVTVGGSPFEGAIVSLYKSGDPQPYSAVTDASGNVSITHPLTGTVKLTVTGFNLDTYSQDHVVGSTSTLIANFSGTPLVIPQGGTVDFTDLSTPTGTIISWDWQFPGAVTTTSTVQNPAGIQYNTPGQYNVSLTVGDGTDTHTETKTNYITVTGPLTANFMGTPTTIMAGQTVDFTDQSAGGGTITNWDWQFPGAVTTASTNQNPAGIQYNNPGTYDVTLTITDDASSTDSETKNAYITVLDPNAFMTDFYASATVIIEGQSVDFFDDTQNGPATSWTWNFGNGQTSSVQNPAAIVYDIPGFYTVTLTSSDGTDTDTETKIDYIEVIDSSYLPIADFTANFTTVMVGGSVDFYDLSQNGPITWDWTFTGADVPTSAIQDPTVITYSTVGVYPVTLAVTNPIGSDTITKTDYITVIDNSSLGPLEADFHATTNRLIIMGETVSFEDLTVGFPTNWNWIFAGGTPASSTDQHPMDIMYASPGFYDVTLIVTNGAYSDTIVKADYIVVTSELWPDPDGFCDTISNITSNDFPLGFRHLAPTKWGYFPGHNGYSIKAYAEKFTNYTFSNVQGMIVPVVKAYSASSNPKVRFTVWDVDTTGMPGNIIEYKDVQIGSFTPYLYHSVIFDNPAEIDGEFFVGFQVYYYTPQDTFAVYMAPNRGIGGENSLYVKKATWTTPSVILNDTLNTSLGIDLIGCLVEKEEITLEDNINIYPNPTSGIVNISFSDMETGNVKVMVYDIYGRVVLNGPVVEYMQDYTLNLSEMDSGLYLISIEADGLILNRKITLVK